jgi:multisubunit Na+/H+ antiporter MnhF subunit
MRDIFLIVVVASLVIHIALIAVALGRVWRGDDVMDRIVAADVIGTIVLAIFVILALIRGDALFIDLALGFAALSFIATIALARYIGNRQMF